MVWLYIIYIYIFIYLCMYVYITCMETAEQSPTKARSSSARAINRSRPAGQAGAGQAGARQAGAGRCRYAGQVKKRGRHHGRKAQTTAGKAGAERSAGKGNQEKSASGWRTLLGLVCNLEVQAGRALLSAKSKGAARWGRSAELSYDNEGILHMRRHAVFMLFLTHLSSCF